MTFQMANAAYLVENIEKFGNYLSRMLEIYLKINQQERKQLCGGLWSLRY